MSERFAEVLVRAASEDGLESGCVVLVMLSGLRQIQPVTCRGFSGPRHDAHAQVAPGATLFDEGLDDAVAAGVSLGGDLPLPGVTVCAGGEDFH
jgi:hypothetical protein